MDKHGDIKGRWEHVGKFLRRGGPFVGAGFTADTAESSTVRKMRHLLIVLLTLA